MELIKMKGRKINKKINVNEDYNEFKKSKDKRIFQRSPYHELAYLNVSMVNR